MSLQYLLPRQEGWHSQTKPRQKPTQHQQCSAGTINTMRHNRAPARGLWFGYYFPAALSFPLARLAQSQKHPKETCSLEHPFKWFEIEVPCKEGLSWAAWFSHRAFCLPRSIFYRLSKGVHQSNYTAKACARLVLSVSTFLYVVQSAFLGLSGRQDGFLHSLSCSPDISLHEFRAQALNKLCCLIGSGICMKGLVTSGGANCPGCWHHPNAPSLYYPGRWSPAEHHEFCRRGPRMLQETCWIEAYTKRRLPLPNRRRGGHHSCEPGCEMFLQASSINQLTQESKLVISVRF